MDQVGVPGAQSREVALLIEELLRLFTRVLSALSILLAQSHPWAALDDPRAVSAPNDALLLESIVQVSQRIDVLQLLENSNQLMQEEKRECKKSRVNQSIARATLSPGGPEGFHLQALPRGSKGIDPKALNGC